MTMMQTQTGQTELGPKAGSTPEIVLIRGLPGSGKTTMGVAMGESHVLCEADLFYMVGTEYRYDASRIQKAHDWCLAQAKQALAAGKNVVVANTFCRLHEMTPYYNLGAPVRVLEATGCWPSIHGVPQDKIEKMRQRWETFPSTQKPKFGRNGKSLHRTMNANSNPSHSGRNPQQTRTKIPTRTSTKWNLATFFEDLP